MVFNSMIFLCIFLPAVLAGYYLLPGIPLKNTFLLLCSFLFYAWAEPKYLPILVGSILVNYTLGLLIHREAFRGMKKDSGQGQRINFRKLILAAGILANIGLLFVFKYLTFVMEQIRNLMDGDYDVLQIALPVGISFYTFQGISYLMDLYRKEGQLDEKGERISFVQKNPLNFAVYISMFAYVSAGPIVRYQDVSTELSARKLTAEGFAAGAERFIVGLAKKAILANFMGTMADSIFNSDYTSLGAGAAWLGAIAYTLQIYLDFSGYSDMAIGIARMLGFRIRENFNAPYLSRSIREFWRRWHISLSGWFRDYLYIPLGGSRRGNVYVNLLLVFIATGIWHGAAWGFLIWGLWHGCFIVMERLADRIRERKVVTWKLPAPLAWFLTMLVVVIGWVMFRLPESGQFLGYLKVMAGLGQKGYIAYGIRYYLSNQMICYLTGALLVCLPWSEIRKRLMDRIADVKIQTGLLVVKRLILAGLYVLSYIYVINSSYDPFIYFRF